MHLHLHVHVNVPVPDKFSVIDCEKLEVYRLALKFVARRKKTTADPQDRYAYCAVPYEGSRLNDGGERERLRAGARAGRLIFTH